MDDAFVKMGGGSGVGVKGSPCTSTQHSCRIMFVELFIFPSHCLAQVNKRIFQPRETKKAAACAHRSMQGLIVPRSSYPLGDFRLGG